MPFSAVLINRYESGFFELARSQILFESITRLKNQIQPLKDKNRSSLLP